MWNLRNNHAEYGYINREKELVTRVGNAAARWVANAGNAGEVNEFLFSYPLNRLADSASPWLGPRGIVSGLGSFIQATPLVEYVST